jgi:chromosome condensin MukBEF MukE localization factor
MVVLAPPGVTVQIVFIHNALRFAIKYQHVILNEVKNLAFLPCQQRFFTSFRMTTNVILPRIPESFVYITIPNHSCICETIRFAINRI